jgi:hypothetical protein
VIGFVLSARTAVMRPSSVSTRIPQLWEHSTQTEGWFCAVRGNSRRETDGSTAVVWGMAGLL